MNIEAAFAIVFLLIVVVFALIALALRERVRRLERDLQNERDYRREVQAHSYEVSSQLRQGFAALGLKWEGRKDAGWSK